MLHERRYLPTSTGYTEIHVDPKQQTAYPRLLSFIALLLLSLQAFVQHWMPRCVHVGCPPLQRTPHRQVTKTHAFRRHALQKASTSQIEPPLSAVRAGSSEYCWYCSCDQACSSASEAPPSPPRLALLVLADNWKVGGFSLRTSFHGRKMGSLTTRRAEMPGQHPPQPRPSQARRRLTGANAARRTPSAPR